MSSLDPKPMTARFNSKCEKCGEPIKKGENFYYWPIGKHAYCKKCGEPEYLDFISTLIDEEMSKVNSRM
jgi:hypothetical protein